MYHRGPDEEGCFVRENYGCAMRRLSIIDLERGSQPIFRDKGNLVIVYNGEVYNYQEIRKELNKRGYLFSTNTDTETVLAAYEEWGEDCLVKLNGIFGFAIYDLRKKELFLARDRLGVKPLFYYKSKTHLLFASEVKALLTHPEVPRKINLSALSDFLSYSYVSEGKSPIEKIFSLPPGHFIKVRFSGEFILRQYWRIPYQERKTNLNKREIAEEIYSLLRDSVRKQLVSDVGISIMLSSGIDSATLAYILHSDLKFPMKAFSIGLENRFFDESKDAGKLAQKFDMQWHTELITSGMVLRDFPEIVYHADSLQGNTAQIIYYYCTKLIHDNGYKVTLNGSGGDELFWGYPTYRADKIFCYWNIIPEFLKQVLRKGANVLPSFSGRVSLDYMIKKFVEYAGNDMMEAHAHWRTIFPAKEQQHLFKKDFWRYLSEEHNLYKKIYTEYCNASRWRKIQISDFYAWLVPLLSWVDGMSMANSVELRVPYLDHRMVEKAITLPSRYQFKGYRLKSIMKEFLRNRLPKETLSIQKRGTHVPLGDWLKKELKPLTSKYLSEEQIKNLRIFDYNFVKLLMQNHMNGKENNTFKIWNLLVFSAWAERFKVSI